MVVVGTSRNLTPVDMKPIGKTMRLKISFSILRTQTACRQAYTTRIRLGCVGQVLVTRNWLVFAQNRHEPVRLQVPQKGTSPEAGIAAGRQKPAGCDCRNGKAGP